MWWSEWHETFVRVSIACGVGLALLMGGTLAAEVPSKLTHQGRLLDDDGTPVTES